MNSASRPTETSAAVEIVTREMIEAGAQAGREYYERTGGNSPEEIYRAMRAVAVAGEPQAATLEPTGSNLSDDMLKVGAKWHGIRGYWAIEPYQLKNLLSLRALSAGTAAAPTDGHLREVLRELLESSRAECPSFEQGKEAQDEWADRRAKARNDAVDALSQPVVQELTTQQEELIDLIMLDRPTSVAYRLKRIFHVLALQAGKPQDRAEGSKLATYPLEDMGLENASAEHKLFKVCDWQLTVGDVLAARKATGGTAP